MLRDIADFGAAVNYWVALEGNRSRTQALLAQDALQQHRLARAISSNHGNEFAWVHIKAQISPNAPLSEAERSIFDAEHWGH